MSVRAGVLALVAIARAGADPAGTAPPVVLPASARNPAIEAQLVKRSAAIAKGNPAAAAAVYAEDAVAMPPGAPAVRGRAAIRDLWSAIAGSARLRVESTSLTVAGEMAIEDQVWILETQSGEPVDRGKAITVWKKTREGWRIWRDIWNSDQSAAPASR